MNYASYLAACLFVMAAFHSGYSQTMRKNDKGETIIVYDDGSWRYHNETIIRSPGDYPVTSAEVAPLDNPVILTEEVARKIAYRQEQMAEEASSIAERRVNEARQQSERIQEELQNAGESATPEQLRRLNIRLYAAKQTQTNAENEVLLAHTELNKARELRTKGNILDAFRMRQKERANRIDLPQSSNLSPNFLSAFDPLTDFYTSQSNNYSTFGKIHEEGCTYTFDGIDESSGQRRREMPKRLLFTHTDDRLRLFMKDQEYLRCEAYLSSIAGGYRFLTLEFTFAYPNAKEAYGFIEKGSILTIKLLDGGFINVKSGTLDQGSYDINSQILSYRVVYPIDQSQLSFLQKSEVDSLRVYWSTGYEEYDVYEIDFFMDQMECLNRR